MAELIFDLRFTNAISRKILSSETTEALLLKPKNAKEPLPAILGLHDHGGNKYFGKRKITRTSNAMHPKMIDHQKKSYGGKAWANEIARRGYVVFIYFW